MAKTRKLKNKGRFYAVLLGFAAVLSLAVFLARVGLHGNEIAYGSIGAELDMSGVIVRDEAVVRTEAYEKVTFDVVEGQTVEDGTLIAEVFKRGYQDETMVTLLNLQKQVYAHQMELLAGTVPPELADVDTRILTVEDQIRAASRGQTDLDMLALEQSLKDLQSERSTVLRTLVSADPQLTTMYSQLDEQQNSVKSWKRDVVNSAGTGIISFYFDGYEQALAINKLSTINADLIDKVVAGGNTSVVKESVEDIPLYRLIKPTHWYLLFVTKATDPLRLSAGEKYFITFTDYSDQVYEATAREPAVSDKQIVNILEFSTDIGKLVGVRMVSAKVTKSAQGLVVPVDAIDIVNGVAGLNIKYGDQPLRVEIDVLAEDGKKAVIRARNSTDTLAVGQKYIKP